MAALNGNRSSSLAIAIVRRHCPPAARAWWDEALCEAQSLPLRDKFAQTYAKVVRMLGRALLELDQDQVLALQAAGFPAMQRRAVHELGRMVLLLRAIEHLAADMHAEFVGELYARGDNAEREALLRALPLLPEPARFLSTAVEGCRTNVLPVFEAIACENPYPHGYFPEVDFNQMVMKAVFTGVALPRIVGLSMRLTPALAQMAQDYVQERTMAGRSVPDDIGLIVAEADAG